MEYLFSLFSLSKSATTSALNWSELILLIFGIVLVAGLVGEYKTPEPHSRRMKFFEMLVIVGVLGELLGDGGIFLFSKQLQVISEIEIAGANKNAGDAKDSAIAAQHALEEVSKHAEAIQGRLNKSSAQLNAIEQQVRAQGPRWLILAENKVKFIHDMKPFKGTKLTILMCGGGISPPEQFGTEQKLLELLGRTPIGANWETGYKSWRECPNTSSNGLEMSVSANAGEATRKAAEALRDELLGLGIATGLDIAPADRTKFEASFFGDADSPPARILQEPNTVFLLVAPSAMVESAKPSKETKKTPR